MASPPITSITPLVMDITTKLVFLVGLHGVLKDRHTDKISCHQCFLSWTCLSHHRRVPGADIHLYTVSINMLMCFL